MFHLNFPILLSPWSHTQVSPLGGLVKELAVMMERPIVPPIDDVQVALDLELLAVRKSLIADFERRFPTYDLNQLWQQIQESNKEIKVVKGMSVECLTAFSNVTFWCYAKEGTRQSGRFSITRMWRAAGVDRESIESYVTAVQFKTSCGSCKQAAIATSRSASVKSSSRATSIHCSHCGHVDTVGRKADSYFLGGDFTPRLSCPCLHCDNVRKGATDKAKSQVNPVLRSMAMHISNLAHSTIERPGAWQDSYRSDNSYRSKNRDLLASVREHLSADLSLEDALRSAGADNWKGIKDQTYLMAMVVSHGFAYGWLQLESWKEIASDSENGLAAMRSIDHAIAYLGKYSLEELRNDLLSGDAKKLCNAVRKCPTFAVEFPAPIEVLVKFNGEGVATVRDSDDGMAHSPHLQSRREPTPSNFGTPHGTAHHVALADATELMRTCAIEVDCLLGEGTAKRCPELVAQLMAVVRAKEL